MALQNGGRTEPCSTNFYILYIYTMIHGGVPWTFKKNQTQNNSENLVTNKTGVLFRSTIFSDLPLFQKSIIIFVISNELFYIRQYFLIQR